MSSSVPEKVTKAAMLMGAYSSGLGAVKLASSVQALRLQIHRSSERQGEMQFLREVLPRLAYNNPRLPIHVSYTGKSARVDSAEASEQSTSSSSIASDPAGQKERKTPKPGVISIEYADMPSRQIFMGDKTVSDISNEVLRLASFTDRALHDQRQSNTGEGSSEGQTAADVKRDAFAPEATATSLMGSAEGQADVEGVGAIDARA